MAYVKIDNIVIENARIRWRNFSGAEKQYNRKGDRNFCVMIDDPGQAALLMQDGWNIRTRNTEDDDEEPRYYIQVAVSFDHIPPRVFMVTRKTKTQLNEATIGTLDHADIANVDLTIRPYCWEVNGKTGIKAYLKTMFVTIDEEVYEEKYVQETFL